MFCLSVLSECLLGEWAAMNCVNQDSAQFTSFFLVFLYIEFEVCKKNIKPQQAFSRCQMQSVKTAYVVATRRVTLQRSYLWPVLTKGVVSRFYHFWGFGTVRQYTNCRWIWCLNQAWIVKDRKVTVSCSVRVKWRTQWMSFLSWPGVSHIGPSDLRHLLWDRVTFLFQRELMQLSFY